MDEAWIHDERLGRRARYRVEKIELRPLVPALVHLEQDATVGEELPGHRVVEARQLLELAAPDRNDVQLARARHIGADEQPRAVMRERER